MAEMDGAGIVRALELLAQGNAVQVCLNAYGDGEVLNQTWLVEESFVDAAGKLQALFGTPIGSVSVPQSVLEEAAGSVPHEARFMR